MKNSVAHVMEYAGNLHLEQHKVVAHGMLQYSLQFDTGTLDVINLKSSTV